MDCSLLFDMLSDSNVVLLNKALNRLTAPTLVILSPLMSSSFSEWLWTSPGAICCQVSEAVVSYLEVFKRKLMLVYNISRRSSITASDQGNTVNKLKVCTCARLEGQSYHIRLR